MKILLDSPERVLMWLLYYAHSDESKTYEGFNEIDGMSEIASEYILDKLLEIRTATHTKHYELERKRKPSRNEPKNYIYFKGRLYIEKN